MIIASRHLGKVLLLFTVSLLFVQCQKDEPSTEAKVETTMALFSNAAMQGKLTINESYLAIERMDVEANSTTGSQVVLSSPNSNPDTRISLTGSGETPFNYDLTQGKYDPLTFAMYLQSDSYELKMLEGTSTPDFADFLQNSTPSMVFSGTFSNRGQVVRVFVSLDLPNRLLFSGTQLGQTLVGLANENRARITVDAAYILQDLTIARLEAATAFDFQGQPTILIHPSFNSNLYLDIEDRMFDASKIFKAEIIQIGSNG